VVLAGTHGFAIVEIERVCLASHKDQKATIAYFSKDLTQTLQRLYPKPTATRTHYSASKGLTSTARQPQPTQPPDNRRLPERPGAAHHDDAGATQPTTQTPAPHDGPPSRPADHPDEVNGPSTSAPAVVTPTAPSDEKRRAFLSNVAKAICVWLHEKVEEQADALEFILTEIGVGAAMRLLAQTEEIELNAGGMHRVDDPTRARTRGGVFFNVFKTAHHEAYKKLNVMRKKEQMRRKEQREQRAGGGASGSDRGNRGRGRGDNKRA